MLLIYDSLFLVHEHLRNELISLLIKLVLLHNLKTAAAHQTISSRREFFDMIDSFVLNIKNVDELLRHCYLIYFENFLYRSLIRPQ